LTNLTNYNLPIYLCFTENITDNNFTTQISSELRVECSWQQKLKV